MLTLTRGAADIAEAIVAQADTPDGAVLRLAARPRSENGNSHPELQLIVAERPKRTDVLVKDLPIAVEPAMLEFLDDKVLDAEVEGRDIHFSIYRQPED